MSSYLFFHQTLQKCFEESSVQLTHSASKVHIKSIISHVPCYCSLGSGECNYSAAPAFRLMIQKLDKKNPYFVLVDCPLLHKCSPFTFSTEKYICLN